MRHPVSFPLAFLFILSPLLLSRLLSKNSPLLRFRDLFTLDSCPPVSFFALLQLTLDAEFIKDMGLDSLDVVECVMAVEDEFGTPVSFVATSVASALHRPFNAVFP